MLDAPTRERLSARREDRPTTAAATQDARPLAGSNMAVYLPWVDLLRFVACVLVIYSHASIEAKVFGSRSVMPGWRCSSASPAT